MSTPVTHLSIKLGEKTIELTADEARRLYDFLRTLLTQDPPPPVTPWTPIIVPVFPTWPSYPTQPWFGDPILPGPTCGGTDTFRIHPETDARCLNAVL